MDIQDKIEEIESDDKLSDINILYELLELAVNITGRGDISDDYTKDIEFEIGNIIIYTNEYYSQLTIESEDGEYEINENDEIIEDLINEVKKRLIEFDKKTKKIREKISDEVFNKPLNKKLLMAIQDDSEDEN
ncbi:MAG: hypothetical protein Q8N99_07610 [Nanoarchaeota archaeon]|nr:hypothetical protein [Nanoarchaeota archaeon]